MEFKHVRHLANGEAHFLAKVGVDERVAYLAFLSSSFCKLVKVGH